MRRERYLSLSHRRLTERLSMMLAFDVRPTNESIRKGLKQHPMRGSHNDCQYRKMSKCHWRTQPSNHKHYKEISQRKSGSRISTP